MSTHFSYKGFTIKPQSDMFSDHGVPLLPLLLPTWRHHCSCCHNAAWLHDHTIQQRGAHANL